MKKKIAKALIIIGNLGTVLGAALAVGLVIYTFVKDPLSIVTFLLMIMVGGLLGFGLYKLNVWIEKNK